MLKYIVFAVFTIHLVGSTVYNVYAHNSRLMSLDIDDKDDFCLDFNVKTRTIILCGGSTDITRIYEVLANDTLLKEIAPKTWLLNANLGIAKGATLFINSTDTTWLKINSTRGITYHIEVLGNLIVDGVKITSWDTDTNDVDILGTDVERPRAHITVWNDGTGQTNITNSEIAYLGYKGSKSYGLAYYSGNGSSIMNTKMHHLYFGFYSDGISNMTIENNEVYENHQYGIDPHTYTQDMIIRGNYVHDNGKHGIICSVSCSNIIIENNESFDNSGHGIMLHNNVKNSVVRDNIIYNNTEAGIAIFDSHNNEVYLNAISGGKYGIRVNVNSSYNNIHDNSIKSASYGIYPYSGASYNTFFGNTIRDSTTYGVYIKDSDSLANVFSSNKLSGNDISIKISNSTATFISNLVSSVNYYSLANNATLNFLDTAFNNHVAKSTSGTNTVTIDNRDKRIVKNDQNIENIVDPSKVSLEFSIPSGQQIILTTIPLTIFPTIGSVTVTSVSSDFETNSQYKAWNEKASTSTSVTHKVGGFEAGSAVIVSVDNNLITETADSLGYVQFSTTEGTIPTNFELTAVKDSKKLFEEPEDTGSIEVEIRYTNGELINNRQTVLQVFQDKSDSPYVTVKFPESNPYLIDSLPLGHKYKVKVYVNNMYATTGFLNLEEMEAQLNLNIPLRGGYRFVVLYNDDFSPIKGATVSVKSDDGHQLRQEVTIHTGETPRFWLQSNDKVEDDYYIAEVSLGEDLVYTYSPVIFHPATRGDIEIVTPWPKIIDKLITISVYKDVSQKVKKSDGNFVVELYDAEKNKVAKSSVNVRGDAFVSNLKVGRHLIQVVNSTDDPNQEPEIWGTKGVVLTGKEDSISILKKGILAQGAIPSWIKNNAGWWSEDQIEDSDFVLGIQFLINEGIIILPPTTPGSTSDLSDEIPSWIKNNAGWWAKGVITDSDFVSGIQWLITKGIIKV